LTERKIGPLTGFRNKMGRPFNAIIKLNAVNLPEFDFGQGVNGEDGSAEEVDFSGQESLGDCPKCAAHVFEHGMAYVCEKSVGPTKSCDFRSGKVILQQPVETAQMQKLLATGRTDLLKDFISSRTRRKFSAFLVRGTDGKVGFEFEKREAKAKVSAKPSKIAAEKAMPKTPAKKAAVRKKADSSQ
jgi:DNA topoisomerase III